MDEVFRRDHETVRERIDDSPGSAACYGSDIIEIDDQGIDMSFRISLSFLSSSQSVNTGM